MVLSRRFRLSNIGAEFGTLFRWLPAYENSTFLLEQFSSTIMNPPRSIAGVILRAH